MQNKKFFYNALEYNKETNVNNIIKLEQQLFKCRACHLRIDCIAPTSFNGTSASPLMIVGEGPGKVEDEYGSPLVGPSGKLLDKALLSIGITRNCIFTTNVIKCRPKFNRTPTIQEGKFCANLWLDKEITLISPKIIICLGNVALKYLRGSEYRITTSRGEFFISCFGIIAMSTYHPAYLLRLNDKEQVKIKWHVFHDLKAAKEKCLEFVPEYQFANKAPTNLLKEMEHQKNNRKKFYLSENSN